MNDLKQLIFTELIDLLSTQTENYLAMLRNGITGEQYEQCKAAIKIIQQEVELRRTMPRSSQT
jgi:hypothetical protein